MDHVQFVCIDFIIDIDNIQQDHITQTRNLNNLSKIKYTHRPVTDKKISFNCISAFFSYVISFEFFFICTFSVNEKIMKFIDKNQANIWTSMYRNLIKSQLSLPQYSQKFEL